MPKISSHDYTIRLLGDLDQVTQIPAAQCREVLRELIAYAREIRSLPLPGELRGRLGVHAMNAIFTIAEHDPESARALRALAARLVDERELGVARPGISTSMPWPNPLDVPAGETEVRRDDPEPAGADTDRYADDAQRRADEQSRYADEQRRRMYDEQRRRMLEDDRRRMFEDEERRRRDAERYR